MNFFSSAVHKERQKFEAAAAATSRWRRADSLVAAEEFPSAGLMEERPVAAAKPRVALRLWNSSVLNNEISENTGRRVTALNKK